MKKLLLTLIVSLTFCGSIFAQYSNPNNYTSNWAGADATWGQYGEVDYPAFFIKLDGEFITAEDDWADFEFASFIGNECRGHDFLTTEYIEYGWPLPMLEGLMIKYEGSDEEVTFQMYNHATQTYYTFESCYPAPILTGEDHIEDWVDIFDDNFELLENWEEHALYLNFTSPTTEAITREIVGFSNNPNNWYLIANPLSEDVNPADITGTTAEDEIIGMTDGAFDLYLFNQSAAVNEDGISLEWENWKAENFALEPGKGYLYAHDETITLSFRGNTIPEDVNAEFPLDYDGDIEFKGVNLMGNPFGVPAYANRDFYVLNGEGEVSTDPVNDRPLEAIEGAFFYAEGPDETVAFSTTEFNSKGSVFALNLSDNGKVIDRAAVRLGEGSQLPKFQLNRNHTKLYIPVDNKDYAIVRSEGMGELPVNFKAENNGTYSLTLSSKDVEFSYLHLIDNLTGADQDLLVNPSYSFNASTTDYASRFRLVFATGNDEDNFAFFSNGSLVVNNEGNATLQVIDVTGRIVKCESINGSASVSIDAAPGVYMVRLVNGNDVKVQKVVK